MVAFQARYALYVGGLVALYFSVKRKKRSEILVRDVHESQGKLSRFLRSTRALEAGLKKALLEPREPDNRLASEELAQLAEGFRVAVRQDFRNTSSIQDPRAVHFVRKVRDALPAGETSEQSGSPPSAPEILAPDDLEARRRLLKAHAASLDLIEFLQVELGVQASARVDVSDLIILPRQIGL
jgi:hypothetical protein